jgi:hypothetical protein
MRQRAVQQGYSSTYPPAHLRLTQSLAKLAPTLKLGEQALKVPQTWELKALWAYKKRR